MRGHGVIEIDPLTGLEIQRAAANNTEKAIMQECSDIANFLIGKNRAYGNSALDPVRIFSKSDNVEQLLVRIDDKLSRLMRGTEYPGDNDVDDLIGYLVLLKVAMKNTWR